ncbi:MAG: hypothetical protein ACQEQM_00950 [Thermoplasmatota archaeon]
MESIKIGNLFIDYQHYYIMAELDAVCPKCGTHFKIEKDTESKDCPFCGKKIFFGEKSRI